MNLTKKTIGDTVGMLIVVVAAIVGTMAITSPTATALPYNVMVLDEEFTTKDWFIRTGCVTNDPARPNYITFSSIYTGRQDATLELVRVINNQFVAVPQEDLRISVDSKQQLYHVNLKGNARQMFDVTLWHVQPNEQFYLFGQHANSNSWTLLAKWSAAERNECGTYPVQRLN